MMKVLILMRFLHGYGLLLTMAAGGLAFANIFGVLATAVQFGVEKAPDATTIKTWMNTGWVFGVFLGLMGAIVEKRNRVRKSKLAAQRPDTVKGQILETEKATIEQPQTESAQPKRRGALVSAGWGGFFGTLLGTGLGVTFILIWFSIVYSPFAPEAWSASVSSERHRNGASGREEIVKTTDHPIALYAFAIPVALCAAGGAVFGGVVRVREEG